MEAGRKATSYMKRWREEVGSRRVKSLKARVVRKHCVRRGGIQMDLVEQ